MRSDAAEVRPVSRGYLNALSADQRESLIKTLHAAQKGACFICEKPIDLQLHADLLDIDHVEPLKVGGKDDPSNFALTHQSCNRSKQASDLRVARVLARFATIRDEVAIQNRGPNLSDVLRHYKGAKHELPLKRDGTNVCLSYPELGRNDIQSLAHLGKAEDALDKGDFKRTCILCVNGVNSAKVN